MPGSDRHLFDRRAAGGRLFFDAPQGPAARTAPGTRDLLGLLSPKTGRPQPDRRADPRYEPAPARLAMVWEPVPGLQVHDVGVVENISDGGAKVRPLGLVPAAGH